MAKVAKIWDGTAWVDLATSVPDLSNYQLKSEGGLTLVKKQTIGTSVTAITVTNAFSATYENYKIIVSGGAAGTDGQIATLRLGASATGYKTSLNYNDWGSASWSAVANATNTVFNYAASGGTGGLFGNIDLTGPFLAARTFMHAPWVSTNESGISRCLHNVNTSYTDFTLTWGNAVTGGTIYVYGYNKG
jgi:hypothetical protein